MACRIQAMDYGIRRLPAEKDWGQRYHLLDGKGRLQLVADYDSPWLPADEKNRVRFARPDGQVVASLDLPEGKGRVRNGRIHTSYALILEHAVYAIINEYKDEHGKKPPFFTIEADGATWLAWNDARHPSLLKLYKKIPANLMIVNDPLESEQLDPVGSVDPSAEEYDFAVTLPVHPFHHADVIMLALVFLFDQCGKN